MNDGRVGARPAHNGWNPVLLLPATTLWRWIVLLAGMPPLSHLVYFIARTPAPPVPSPYNAPPPRRSIWLHSWMTPGPARWRRGSPEMPRTTRMELDCWNKDEASELLVRAWLVARSGCLGQWRGNGADIGSTLPSHYFWSGKLERQTRVDSAFCPFLGCGGRWMLPDQWMIMVAPSTDGQNNPRPDLFRWFLDNEAKTSGAEQVGDVGIIQPYWHLTTSNWLPSGILQLKWVQQGMRSLKASDQQASTCPTGWSDFGQQNI